MTRAEALQLVAQERIHQDQKHGRDHDKPQSTAVWLDHINNYLAKAMRHYTWDNEIDSLQVLVEIAALSVAAIENKADFIDLRRRPEKQSGETE